nr:helicase-related protein [Paracoccus sp. 08]
MCDEVGLGKTIEAGLAIRSLTLSGIASRVLIASPASLTRQWQREMKSKFLLDFARTAPGARVSHERLNVDLTPYQVSEGGLLAPDLVIASTGLLTHRTRRSEVMGAKGWDIALVDEAHYARAVNRQNQLYALVDEVIRPKTSALLLATATPMQLAMQEAFDLMRLTGRVGSFGLDDDVSRQYYEAVQEFVRVRGRISEATLEFLRRAVLEIKLLDPEYWTFIMSAYRSPADQRTVARWVEDARPFPAGDWRLIARVLRAAAPLSRVMLRHTRDLLRLYRDSGKLNANLAERHVRPLDPINFSTTERRVYDALEAYCRDLDTRVRASSRQEDQRRVASVGFYLSFLRLRFASSLHAIRKTLERRTEKVTATLRAHQHAGFNPTDEELEEAVFEGDEEGDEIAVEALLDGRTDSDLRWEQEALRGLLDRLVELVGVPSKLDRLLAELNARRQGSRIRQTVVFTRFKDTLDHLVEELRSRMPSALVGTFSGAGGSRYDPAAGKMVTTTRLEITQSFVRGDIDVLLCTDAAAEGLNLQTADLLINFDLPWNPAKVEQRIGRIDRIGQKFQEIFVANYAYAGSAEERVYGRLLSRLAEAGLIVGPQQIALIPVTEADFRALENPNVSAEELRRIETEAAERLRQSKAAAEALEIPSKELQEFYRAWERSRDFATPVTLADLEAGLSSLANAAPNLLSLTEHPGIFALRYEDGRVSYLTASRDLFDRPPLEVRTGLEFASYGAPAFDRLLELIPDLDASWMRRVSVTGLIGDNRVERVGFSVATQTGPVSVVRVSDLRGIKIDSDAAIGDADGHRVEAKLAPALTAEIHAVAKGVEDVDANKRASAEQLVLSHEIAAAYMETASGANDADDLHRRLRDELIPNKPHGLLVRMRPARLAHRTPMLSETSFRGILGEEANVHISLPQLKGAEIKIDAVIREMRRQGEEMYREEAVTRLRRKISRY